MTSDKSPQLGYFGKPGSFSHLVANRIASPGEDLISCETVADVFRHVRSNVNHRGVVPLENSSAGMIESTINHLVAESAPPVVLAEYALHVRLALLTMDPSLPIHTVYSHFAPLQHCESWLKREYPEAKLIALESTSAAAAQAVKEAGSAAISQFSAAAHYGLQVICFPINVAMQNLTQFFLIGHAELPLPDPAKETSLSVTLKNEVGSLCRFLTAFADLRINLKRIKSQNISGHPNTYIFFIGIEGSVSSPAMQQALSAAGEHSQEIRVLGSYPVFEPFES